MVLRYGAIDEVTIVCATYYARTSDHGYETCAEHLAMAGCLAGGFAKGFGYLDDGLLAGLVHDLGKYSDAFQRRIRNPDHCGPVDHSTAGALLLMRHVCPLAAMAVAGHHAGLPDLGSYGELEGPTFMSRMNRARRAGDCNPLALAQAGETQLNIPQSAFLHGTRSAKPMTSGKRSERWSPYTDMMLTRMLFSALVDADRLDAEFFTSNRIDRAEHHILESLQLIPFGMIKETGYDETMMVVVAYDVSTETPEGRRRLRNVAKICMRYGQRVQNSVFECSVSPSDYLILKHDLAAVMDESQDSLRYYNLGAKYSSRIEYRGRQRHIPVDDVMML